MRPDPWLGATPIRRIVLKKLATVLLVRPCSGNNGCCIEFWANTSVICTGAQFGADARAVSTALEIGKSDRTTRGTWRFYRQGCPELDSGAQRHKLLDSGLSKLTITVEVPTDHENHDATIEDLEPGREYWFAVIANRRTRDGGVHWSRLSNWVKFTVPSSPKFKVISTCSGPWLRYPHGRDIRMLGV